MNIDEKKLKKAVSRTRNWPRFLGIHTDIHYDRATGNVWAKMEFGDNRYTLSGNPDEMIVAKTVCRTSVDEVRQAIYKAVEAEDQLRRHNECPDK